MPDIDKRIVKFERRERIKNIKYIFFVVAALLLFFSISFGFSSKTSKEIEVEVIGFHSMESDTGNIIKIRFKTIDDVVGMATLPRRLILSAGDKVICLQVKTYFGTTKYRFSHILNNKT